MKKFNRYEMEVDYYKRDGLIKDVWTENLTYATEDERQDALRALRDAYKDYFATDDLYKIKVTYRTIQVTETPEITSVGVFDYRVKDSDWRTYDD